MRTVVISVFQSFIGRTILGTDAVGDVIANPLVRVVILAPDIKADYYRDLFASRPNVVVEPVPVAVYGSTFSTRMQRLAVWLLPTYFVRYNLEYLRETGFVAKYFLASFINRLLAPLPAVRTAYRWLDRRLTNTSWFDGILERYQPDLVFAPDIFHHTDAHLVWAAKKRRIPTLAMVRSWDCTTNKNLLRAVCDRTLTNNDQVKEELARLHGVPTHTIEVVGFLQYDAYAHPEPVGRTEFCEHMGLDPAKRIILLAVGGRLTDRDWEYAQIIKNAIIDGRLPDDLQILVRNHPQAPADMSRFADDPLFVNDRPGVVLGGNYRAAEMDSTAVRHAIDSCYHAAIGVSVNTSFGLDLAILDRPHVMLAFDGTEQRPWLHSVARYHQEDNMKSFIQTGAVRIAGSPDALIEDMRAYLADPSLDASGRERARRTVLWRLDGEAGKRVASVITSMLS